MRIVNAVLPGFQDGFAPSGSAGPRFAGPSPALIALSLSLLVRALLLHPTRTWHVQLGLVDGLSTPLLLGVWIAAFVAWAVLRTMGRLSEAPRAALEVAAYGLAAAVLARVAATVLPARLVETGPHGTIAGPSSTALSGMAEATTALGLFAYGLGLGLAVVVGLVERQRFRRREGWALRDM